jgi:hypothetical protein
MSEKSMPGKKSDLSDAAIQQRRKGVEEALADAAIEGYVATADELAVWECYIVGTQSLETTTKKLQKMALSRQNVVSIPDRDA